MDFSYSVKVRELQERLGAFMTQYVYSAESAAHEELEKNRRAGNPWQPLKVIEDSLPSIKRAGWC